MKRNFKVVVKDHDGIPHFREVFKYDAKTGMPIMEKAPDGILRHAFDHNEPVTLQWYALNALGGRWSGEERMDGGDRMRLYNKICMSPDGVVDIDGTEIATIITALTNQGRSFVVVDAMQTMLNTDPVTNKEAA